MGVVDRNAPVVLDLEAIWMICSRLDISMNHRSPATATFKAQLVTETPAIEMEKKCVFEQDRSFETLDQFLGFEKIAVAIGTSGPIGSPMSIMCPVKLEAQKDCLSFGETSPMAPPSRCSFGLQSRSSAVDVQGFNRAMQVVFHTTGAVSGRLTSGSAPGLDSNANMKAGDFGALPDVGLCVLRARLECRNFLEVPRVCTSYWVPILQAEKVMVKRDWKQLCPEKQVPRVCTSYWVPMLQAEKVMVKRDWKQLCPEKQAGEIGLLLARKPFKSWAAELELSRDFAEARKLFSAWLFGLRDNRSEPPTILYPDGMAMISSKEAVKGNWKQPSSARQAGSSSESFWKTLRMTPPAARCSFTLQNSSAVDGKGLNQAGRSSEVFRKNVRMTPLAARCSFGLQSRSSAVDVQGFNRAMQVVFHTTGAVSGAVRLAGRLTSGSAPGLDSNATMKAGDFGSLLAELAADVAVPRVRQSCMLPILLKAGQSSGAFRKKFRMTPPAARCSFMLQNSSAVDGKGLNQVSQKNSSMTLHASRCSFALQNSSRAVERTYFNRAMQVVFHTTGAISGRLTRATGFDKNVTMKAGDFGSLLAELALDVLRARLKCRKCRNSSEVPRVCTSYWVPKKQEVMEKGDWKQLCRPEKQMVSVTRGLEFSAEVCVGPCFRSFRSFHEAGAIGLLLARKPFKSWGAELELSRDFFEACKLFGAWLLGLRDNRSEPATILYPNGMALISSKEVKGNWKQPFSAKQAGRSSEAFRKSFRMTPPAARCSFGLQSRSSAVHVQGFNRAMQVVFRTTGADSGLDSNATMKAMDPSPEQWKYDADTPLQSPRSLCAVPTNMKYKPVYLCCHGFARWVRVARNPSESSWKNSSVTLPASRCSFALQNRSRAGERAGFNRAMQVVFRSTGAVSGLDSNGTMETMEVDEDKCAKCPSYLNGAANVREAGDSGALLPDLGLCVFRARLQRRHFSEVPRVRQSCMLLKAQKRVAPLRRFEFGVAWTARCYGWCLQFQATLPRPVKQAVVPALDRDIWMRTSMSIRCSFVVVQKEEPEDILQATDSMFRPMSWSRRLKALDSLESDSQLCGPPHGARHDPLHLNDVWTPLKHAESAEPSENLSCQVPMHTDLAIEEDVHKEKVELRKGCRLLTVQSRELYPLSAGSTARTPRTRTTRTKRRKEVLCDVAEKTGAANAKLVAFSGALRSGRTDASVAGNDLAGWTHDGFSQLDLGDKLALQNPFESVLIETGALLQECEPEELIMLTVSHGGNSAYRLASNIERATGRAVRGVVMWDFLSAFGRGIQGPPLNTTEAVLMKVEGHTMLSASPAFRCRCEHPIQMVAGHKTGELAMDLLMDRTRAESAVKVMYKELQIQKVQECHFGFERTNWDMLRLILSARPPKNTTDAAEGDIGAA